MLPALPPERTGIRDLPFAIPETPDRYIQGNYWTAITGRSAGLAVFNRGTMALVREDDASVSVPLAYSMYYIWGTRILNLYTRNNQMWVRLFADSDRPATVHVRSGNQPLSIADLAGRASERISGPIKLRPWQIQTVALARATES